MINGNVEVSKKQILKPKFPISVHLIDLINKLIRNDENIESVPVSSKIIRHKFFTTPLPAIYPD